MQHNQHSSFQMHKMALTHPSKHKKVRGKTWHNRRLAHPANLCRLENSTLWTRNERTTCSLAEEAASCRRRWTFAECCVVRRSPMTHGTERNLPGESQLSSREDGLESGGSWLVTLVDLVLWRVAGRRLVDTSRKHWSWYVNWMTF